MPKSAIATGYVDFALPAAEMGERLVQFAKSSGGLDLLTVNRSISGRKTDIEAARTEICDIIRHQIGHDFEGYKTKTFLRRVQRRMQVRQTETLEAYIELLRQEPQEVTTLFRDLLINVTNFFRDAEAFDKLAESVIPKLFENRGADDVVRVWVPGCSTGEEVYSIAILLREHMNTLRALPRVQVFATDIDDEALSVARAGRYPAALLDNVSPERKTRFFLSDSGSYVVSKDVRDLCIFSPHSLIRDPPFSRIDLVSCRNLLIYFGPVVQNQVIPTFHYSLRPGGYLFLGMSENVSQFPDLFDPIDKKHRIFRSREDAVRRIRLPHNITDGHLSPSGTIRSSGNALGGVGALQHNFEAQILERHAPPHVVVNSEGEVVYFSSRTGRYLESPAGAPTRNLVSLAKKGLRLDISVAFREALEKNTSATRRGLVPEEETGDFLSVSITVEPVWSQNRDDRLYLVLFEAQGAVPGGNKVEGGTSQAQDAALRLEHEQRELKDRLQSTIEEYETALEELKSSNEELVSVNEELQSTNEELEASKEELQSMNEELHTVNNELSLKIDALDTANNDLRNLFESTQIATVFLDHRLTIRSFTPAIAGIFRILPTDRGRPISDLASGLDTSELRKNIEAVLAGGTAVESEIGDESTSSRYLVKINAYRSPGGRIDGVVVTFVDVTKLAKAEAEQQILIDELHHRTRNLLTMVQSLIAQTMKNSRSMEEFQQKLEGRLSALSRVQGLLSSPASEVITVERLLKMELEAYEAKIESERVGLEGPAVVLSDELVKMLALALHELVTNAVKYGALHSPRGQLAVRWKVKKLNGRENLVLDWLETGIDLKADKQNRGTQGFGHYLIRKALPHQFGAVTVYEFLKDSLHCSIDVPLGEKRK